MLCGSKNKKLQQWKLHRLSTYGLLSGLKQTEVVAVMDSLIEAGLLQQKEVDERRPTINMTEAGRLVMLAQDPLPDAVTMPFPLAKRLALAAGGIESGDVQTQSPGSDTTQSESDSDQASPEVAELALRLKQWRRKVSAAQGIPAYRVLTNATIDRIAELCPTSTEQLESVSGVGPATIEQFGFDIVELIRDATQSDEAGASNEIREPDIDYQGNWEDLPNESAAVEDPPMTFDAEATEGPGTELSKMDSEPDPNDAYWTWRLFRDGYTANQIAAIRHCDESVLVSDLILAASAGHSVDPSWITAPEGLQRIRDALAGASISG
jgi:ATP-dependent DNA helicase RecQ